MRLLCADTAVDEQGKIPTVLGVRPSVAGRERERGDSRQVSSAMNGMISGCGKYQESHEPALAGV